MSKDSWVHRQNRAQLSIIDSSFALDKISVALANVGLLEPAESIQLIAQSLREQAGTLADSVGDELKRQESQRGSSV